MYTKKKCIHDTYILEQLMIIRKWYQCEIIKGLTSFFILEKMKMGEDLHRIFRALLLRLNY